MKIILLVIILVLVAGIWFPVMPFPVKRGWHGVGGEWCGIVYDRKCDTRKVGFFTYEEILGIVENKAY